jgi:predicted TIM-barrel fold metal-dependent hydrolase
MPNDGELVDLFYRFTQDPAIQKQILVDNPAQLYGFE